MRVLARLTQDVFPWLGGRPIAEIAAPELLAVLRRAEWSEIDTDNAEWRIPSGKMKMRVPLSSQAVSILRDLHPLTGHGRYVFPGARGNGRPMSENTANAAPPFFVGKFYRPILNVSGSV